jgi:hypothetical protein
MKNEPTKSINALPAETKIQGSGQDEPLLRKQVSFAESAWLPSLDPAAIGEKNISDIQNLRPSEDGIEGVQGYTKINTSALLSTYKKIRSGIQLRTPYTTRSRILAQAFNNGMSASQIIQNVTPIPSQGNFESTALHTDAAGAGIGRFCRWPNNTLAYCNGMESLVWAGDEMPPAAFFCSSAAITDSLTNPIDYTEAVCNSLWSAESCAYVDAASWHTFAIASPRPLQGIKLFTGGNATPAVITGKEFTGSAWAPLAITDGTNGLAQTGTISWPSTVSTSKLKFLQDRLLYWYQFTLSAGSAYIYQVTMDAPLQPVIDIWDGTMRSLLQFRKNSGSDWIDYTARIWEQTPAGVTPSVYYCADLSGMTSTMCIDIGLPERAQAIRVGMFEQEAGYVNTNASVLSVQYWNGWWVAPVSGLVDGTAVDGCTFAQSGFISWTPPDPWLECQKTQFGKTLWVYRITVSAELSASVWVDLSQAIPSPGLNNRAYKFPFMFQNRAMLCNLISTQEGNRVDFALTNTTEVWNGEESSFGVGKTPLYVGGSEELTAACEIYNRLGNSVYTFGLFFKAHETHFLYGYDYETYKVYPISNSRGCPAPDTVDTHQVDISPDGQYVRSVAMWISHSGPCMFDSGGLISVPGLECYFDPTDSRCVNSATLQYSQGKFHPSRPEYHCLLPSGSGQTDLNLWVFYNIKKKRWFKIVPSAAYPYPQALIKAEDVNNKSYTYGCRDNGYMMRLHDETTPQWDGTPSVQFVTLPDIFASGDIWDMIRLRMFKVVAISATEAITASVEHYADGASAHTDMDAVALNGGNRILRHTQSGLNLLAWLHRIKITATVTSDVKGMRLLAWGMRYQIEREDI